MRRELVMKPRCWLWLLVFLAMSGRSVAASREGFVDVGDHVRIHYLQAGPENAPHVLLLIPGWTISSSIWSRQIVYFAAHGYRVIAMDPRSQGGSTVVMEGNAPENRATDIHGIIARLTLHDVVMIGWSQGAQDVAAYVARYGTAKISGLVLVDSPVSAGPVDVKENAGFVTTILQGVGMYSSDPRGYLNGLMHAIISTPTSPQVYAQLDEEAMKTPQDIGISMLIQDMFTTDRRPALKLFLKPTLVVASAKSPLLDAQRNMLNMLPSGKMIVVNNAAHAVFFDQPAVFNRDLDAFIASLDTPHPLSPG
jgi:microsomal epoxide hydrolase